MSQTSLAVIGPRPFRRAPTPKSLQPLRHLSYCKSLRTTGARRIVQSSTSKSLQNPSFGRTKHCSCCSWVHLDNQSTLIILNIQETRCWTAGNPWSECLNPGWICWISSCALLYDTLVTRHTLSRLNVCKFQRHKCCVQDWRWYLHPHLQCWSQSLDRLFLPQMQLDLSGLLSRLSNYQSQTHYKWMGFQYSYLNHEAIVSPKYSIDIAAVPILQHLNLQIKLMPVMPFPYSNLTANWQPKHCSHAKDHENLHGKALIHIIHGLHPVWRWQYPSLT